MSLLGPIVLTSDAAGNATYTTPQLVEGLLQYFYIAYDAAAPGGTDVIIYNATQAAPPALSAIQYLSLVNNNINDYWVPRIDCCDDTGAAVFYDPAGAGNQVEVRDHYYMANQITIDVAQIGAAGRTVTVWIYYSEYR